MSGFLNFEIVLQLILAVFLGGLVGLEREYVRKEAGLRTFSLVCLGAALFTILGTEFSNLLLGGKGIELDPSRIIGQIILGIGFLGAGLIVFRETRIEGLTTAAALWVVAAIGAAIGVRFYFLATFTTFLAILILAGFKFFEEKILKTKAP